METFALGHHWNISPYIPLSTSPPTSIAVCLCIFISAARRASTTDVTEWRMKRQALQSFSAVELNSFHLRLTSGEAKKKEKKIQPRKNQRGIGSYEVPAGQFSARLTQPRANIAQREAPLVYPENTQPSSLFFSVELELFIIKCFFFFFQRIQ